MKWTLARKIGIGVLTFGLTAAAVLKPSEIAAPADSYFDQIQNTLKTRGIDHPVILIDLDRVDGNLAEIRRVLGNDFKLRATTKSLPSYELLEHVLSVAETRRVMEFHGPFLRPLCERLGSKDPLDVLMGKPLPVSDLESFLNGPPLQKGVTVRWLIDTPERLVAYSQVAQKRGVQLPIAFELDVGLHRGGIVEPTEFLSLVKTALADPAHLRITGVMGYDGHVPHAPPFYGSSEGAQRSAFENSMRNLQRFMNPFKEQFSALCDGDFVVNSGGSKTYPRYRQASGAREPLTEFVNELALGSAVLKPAEFDVPVLAAHRPALYIAEPVLKRTSPARLPFADGIGALWRVWNPNRHDAIFVYGGGWALEPAYPAGLISNPLYNDRPADNRIPNQTLLNVARRHPIKPGDFVFYRPLQSDALMQFDEILVFRGGALIATWHPLPRRL